jgi:hypothetical protein
VKTLKSLVIVTLLVAGIDNRPARAQDAAPAPAPRPATVAKSLVPLEVEVVISRYVDSKRISSLPYTLAVNANGPEVMLNMGTEVAVPSAAFTPIASGDAKGAVNPITSYNYRSVGTRISSSASITEDGRFDLRLFIDDSSVYQSPSTVPGGNQMPAFRSFSSRNTLLLRDGQSREYTAATDRVSGEVVKISVTLKVVK